MEDDEQVRSPATQSSSTNIRAASVAAKAIALQRYMSFGATPARTNRVASGKSTTMTPLVCGNRHPIWSEQTTCGTTAGGTNASEHTRVPRVEALSHVGHLSCRYLTMGMAVWEGGDGAGVKVEV